MGVRCKIHGLVPENKCYLWSSKYKGRLITKAACKACTKARSTKQYSKPIPKNISKTDWTGQKFGSLTFIKQTDERYQRNILWELQCECGNLIKKRAYFVIKGIIDHCGCKTKIRRIQAGAKSRIFEPRISSARSIWGRVYSDGCDFETFLRISQMNCYYCGVPPSRTMNRYNQDKRHPKRPGADFTYNGLDRLDSNKDHSPENVVPCCTNCNFAKGEKSVSEFLDHIRSIYFHTLKMNV